MLRWICALALFACAAAPALAQDDVKTDLKDRPLKQIKDFDPEPIKEGMRTTGQTGSCTMTFIVGVNGKARNITADCPSPDFVPYVVRAVEGAEWEAEVVGGYIFASDPVKRIFKFGTTSAPDPRGEKGPVLVKNIEQKDVERVINKVDDAGTCNVTYTVGADGKPKDIQPNCSTPAFNPGIAEAVGKMQFQPGQKGGQPTDWPGMTMPMNLTKPKG
jgi:hypothetical protein